MTKLIIKQAIVQLKNVSLTVEELRTLMNQASARLSEYPIIMQMKGGGPSLDSQLMIESGDATHKGALTAFSSVDPGMNESGAYKQKNVPTSKRGAAELRKTLFQIMDALIETISQDNPVYKFLNKKRTQSKPYYVYNRQANKFL